MIKGFTKAHFGIPFRTFRRKWYIAEIGGIKSIAATASTISSIPKQFRSCTLILDRPYVVGFCALSIIVD